jgi:hypothetical protein
VFFVYQMFCSYEASQFVWFVVVYKHLVPLGPKTMRPIIQTGLLQNFRVSTPGALVKTELRFTKPHKTAPGKILFPMISWITLSLFAPDQTAPSSRAIWAATRALFSKSAMLARSVLPLLNCAMRASKNGVSSRPLTFGFSASRRD